MSIQPSIEIAQQRLRVDDALLPDLQAALDQAEAEARAYLDGALYSTAAEKLQAITAAEAAATAAGQDPAAAPAVLEAQRSIVVTADMHNAMLLLADVYMGSNDSTESERKTRAATNILRRHRNKGT